MTHEGRKRYFEVSGQRIEYARISNVPRRGRPQEHGSLGGLFRLVRFHRVHFLEFRSQNDGFGNFFHGLAHAAALLLNALVSFLL
jgi:hypothetical protein